MDRDELVRLAGEDLAQSIFREAPTEAAGLKAHPFGHISGDEMRFFIYEDVFDELSFAAGYRDEASWAILLGAFAVDETGPFLEVTGFSKFQYIASMEELYPALKPDFDELVEELGRVSGAPKQHVVGLFAASRGCGGRLLAEVARVHLSLFNIPYQVIAALDPETGEFGLHARAPAGSFYNSPFWLVERLEEHPPR